MTFERFMALALYAPGVGYYRRAGPRVGYAPGTDFFTAATSGPVFGQLVAAACVALLRGGDPREFTFVEIGAEPGSGVLDGVAHPFGAARCVRLDEEPALAGDCVVFSNELFDAQPFRRLVFRGGAWREIGVVLRGEMLAEIELPLAADAAAPEPVPPLPDAPGEGYILDAPLAATALARRLAVAPWRGLFVACDYGKSWHELAEHTPAGTARAYHRHTQSNDLLARPGEQDLTCHVCWDWLADALGASGFAVAPVLSQEAFLVRHAGAAIAAVSAAGAAGFSREKLALMQLLHPGNLGQKFQVLHAWRD
ncbi:MAG: hypothetical protein RLZZ15_4247 [Verrucomicrobiota bacterium]